MAQALIIVVGSVHTDLAIRVPRLPRPGETVLGARPSLPYRDEIEA